MKNFCKITPLLFSLLLLGCKHKTESAQVDRNVSDKVVYASLEESKQKLPSGRVATCVNKVSLTERTTLIEENHYGLIFPKKLLTSSSMSYCSDNTAENGTSFEMNYVDPGGKGMDGYVNGVIGGVQKSGSWRPSNSKLTGMPTLLSNLKNNVIIQWKTSQENALDPTDKWMASINLIFDNGEADAKPVASNRDYDLVIELGSHNFNNATEDITEGSKRSYFARDKNGSLRTFDIVVAGKTYRYAVRYKFFIRGDDSDNKTHVKYIPINEANVPPYLNHSLKAFIDNSKAFIQYANMPADKRVLANKKVALPSLYLKSIRAGYEVYKGESTLRNDFFKLVFE